MRNKKYVIFDMDGTLVDSSIVLANAINHVRSKLSLPPMPNSQIVATINNPDIHPPSFFYEAENFTKEHEEWFSQYYTEFHNSDTALYEGIDRVLYKLSSTHSLSIATNAYEISARQTLEANSILDYFEIIVSADMVEKPKPDREMIDRIISYYRADRNDFVLVGDGERDILAAQNAGIDYILVDWGFSDHNDKDAVRSVKELEDILLTPR